MKSYLLVGVESVEVAKDGLRRLLPGQEEPWLLRSALDDPVAYFNVETQLDGEQNIHIQADVSGRHQNNDALVLEAMGKLQALLGGVVTISA
jgi:hypothetical protein